MRGPAGVDIIVAQAARPGHTGQVATMVLIPEVIRAIKPIRKIPVLAAGGIMTGRQMAACMAMGAAGVWTGSVWLATNESETTEIFREKMIAARSRDTVRSRCRTGKPTRQLRSAFTDAWEGSDSPGALPMPLQSLVSEPTLAAAQLAAEKGNKKARELVTYFVGQGVGLVDSVKSCRAVVQEFMEDFSEAIADLNAAVEEYAREIRERRNAPHGCGVAVFCAPVSAGRSPCCSHVTAQYAPSHEPTAANNVSNGFRV